MRHCASCGRTDDLGENGVETVEYLGVTWCTSCAAVGRTSTGSVYVAQQSPGRMYEGPPNEESYDALWDCFVFMPKKRIVKDKARAEIQRAWRRWDGGDDPMLFFGWLRKHRPYFLTFRCKGDPWQTVHSWVLQAERSKEARK